MELDEFYQKIQSYLMKKDAEVGQLKFLSSRTTEDSTKHIDDLTNSIGIIFQAFKIPIKEEKSLKNEKCIQALKYLILNTNFKAQEYLMEDLLNGHLVDMCPPLSPYLLAELTWSLNYEDILAESILHLPLDLCIELFEIIRRCILLLNFRRSFDLVLTLIKNCYIKLIAIRDEGTQSMNFPENLDNLITNYQEFLSLLDDKKFTRLHEVSGIKRSERCGYILRDALLLTKTCLELSKNGVDINRDTEKLYKVTFGRENLMKIDGETSERHLKCLNFELTSILLKKIKEINCNIYLDWASLDADGNPSLSLQQAIGIECYNLIKYIDENNHEDQEHLVDCLKQLSVNPATINPAATMNLKELCDGVYNNNHDCLRELLNKQSNWDNTVINCIRKKPELFDKDDFKNLLNYLTELMQKNGQEEHKQIVYNTVTKVLFNQKISDLYEITLDFIAKNDGKNILESDYTEEMFVKFILTHNNLKSSSSMRTVLFFLLKNPMKYLTILTKISIGCDEYKNIMIPPDDLILLSPILTMENDKIKFLLICLKQIGFDDVFEPKKFNNFIKSILQNCIVTADELINFVYVPWLEASNLNATTLRTMLNNLRQIILSNSVSNIELLLKSLAKRMTQLRNDKIISKYLNSELLTLTIRIVKILLQKNDNWFENSERNWIIELEKLLQPIDKFHYSKLFSSSDYFDVVEIIEDYLRQINTILIQLTEGNDDNNFNNFDINEEILRHLILSCTEIEFVRIASEITVIHWDYFNYNDEADAFDNIVRITIDASCYCLNTNDTRIGNFASLIKSLGRFVKGLIHLEMGIDKKLILDSLLNHFRKLNSSVNGSEYEDIYNEAMVQMNNLPSNESTIESLQEVVNFINIFGDKCLEILDLKKNQVSNEFAKSKVYQDFITNCLIASYDNQTCMMRRVKDLLLSCKS